MHRWFWLILAGCGPIAADVEGPRDDGSLASWYAGRLLGGRDTGTADTGTGTADTGTGTVDTEWWDTSRITDPASDPVRETGDTGAGGDTAGLGDLETGAWDTSSSDTGAPPGDTSEDSAHDSAVVPWPTTQACDGSEVADVRTVGVCDDVFNCAEFDFDDGDCVVLLPDGTPTGRLVGDVWVTSGDGALALADVEEILGTLRIALPPGSTELVDIGSLEVAHGLEITGGGGAVALPGLRELTWGDLVVRDTQLVSLSLPALERVQGSVQLEDNPSLGSVRLPSLGWAGYGVHVEGNPILATLEVPSLQVLGGMYLHDSLLQSWPLPAGAQILYGVALERTQLTSLSLPDLQRTSVDVHVRDNPVLSSVSLPALADVSALYVVDNPALTSLQLPVLSETDRSLHVERNAALSSVDLDHLERVGLGLWMTELPALPSLELPALTGVGRMQVRDVGASRISLPALVVAGSLYLLENSALETVDLPSLEQAEALHVARSPRVTAVDVPQLTTVAPGADGLGDLWIADMDGLESLSLPSLSHASELAVERVPLLTDLSAPELVDPASVWVGGLPSLVAVDLSVLSDVVTMTMLDLPLLTALELPALQTVQDAAFSDAGLVSLELPMLQQVAGDLALRDLPGFADLSAPSLAGVDGALNLLRVAGPPTLAFPQLVHVDRLGLDDCSGISTLSAPLLARVTDAVRVLGVPGLQRLELPELISAGVLELNGVADLAAVEVGRLNGLRNLFVRDADALATLSAPLLQSVGVRLELNDNATLSQLDLPILRFVAELEVVGNPMLSQCDVDELARSSFARFVYSTGNGACP